MGRGPRHPVYGACLPFDPHHWAVSSQEHHPISVDTRTPDEIEDGFARREAALPLLDYCTARQRQVLTLRYGLADGTRRTYRQIADELGFAFESAARDRELEGLGRIRRGLMGDDGLTEEERMKRDAKRKRQREWMARKRAERKELAA